MFAEAAARLAGLAGVTFGWAPATFWDATPAELAALVRAAVGEAPGIGADEIAELRERFPDG